MPDLNQLTDDQLKRLKDLISQEQVDRADRDIERSGGTVFHAWEL